MTEQQPSPPPWKVARAYGTDGRWHGAYVVTEDCGDDSCVLATVWGDDGVVDDPRPARANAILMARSSRLAAALREILELVRASALREILELARASALREILELARAAPEAGKVSGAVDCLARVEAIALEALEGIPAPVDRPERAPVDADSSDSRADRED